MTHGFHGAGLPHNPPAQPPELTQCLQFKFCGRCSFGKITELALRWTHLIQGTMAGVGESCATNLGRQLPTRERPWAVGIPRSFLLRTSTVNCSECVAISRTWWLLCPSTCSILSLASAPRRSPPPWQSSIHCVSPTLLLLEVWQVSQGPTSNDGKTRRNPSSPPHYPQPGSTRQTRAA